MFILPKAQYAMTIGHCQMQLGVGGTLIPLVELGQRPHGFRGEAPRCSDDLAFYSTKGTEKITSMV